MKSRALAVAFLFAGTGVFSAPAALAAAVSRPGMGKAGGVAPVAAPLPAPGSALRINPADTGFKANLTGWPVRMGLLPAPQPAGEAAASVDFSPVRFGLRPQAQRTLEVPPVLPPSVVAGMALSDGTESILNAVDMPADVTPRSAAAWIPQGPGNESGQRLGPGAGRAGFRQQSRKLEEKAKEVSAQKRAAARDDSDEAAPALGRRLIDILTDERGLEGRSGAAYQARGRAESLGAPAPGAGRKEIRPAGTYGTSPGAKPQAAGAVRKAGPAEGLAAQTLVPGVLAKAAGTALLDGKRTFPNGAVPTVLKVYRDGLFLRVEHSAGPELARRWPSAAGTRAWGGARLFGGSAVSQAGDAAARAQAPDSLAGPLLPPQPQPTVDADAQALAFFQSDELRALAPSAASARDPGVLGDDASRPAGLTPIADEPAFLAGLLSFLGLALILRSRFFV